MERIRVLYKESEVYIGRMRRGIVRAILSGVDIYQLISAVDLMASLSFRNNLSICFCFV